MVSTAISDTRNKIAIHNFFLWRNLNRAPRCKCYFPSPCKWVIWSPAIRLTTYLKGGSAVDHYAPPYPVTYLKMIASGVVVPSTWVNLTLLVDFFGLTGLAIATQWNHRNLPLNILEYPLFCLVFYLSWAIRFWRWITMIFRICKP